MWQQVEEGQQVIWICSGSLVARPQGQRISRMFMILQWTPAGSCIPANDWMVTGYYILTVYCWVMLLCYWQICPLTFPEKYYQNQDLGSIASSWCCDCVGLWNVFISAPYPLCTSNKGHKKCSQALPQSYVCLLGHVIGRQAQSCQEVFTSPLNYPAEVITADHFSNTVVRWDQSEGPTIIVTHNMTACYYLSAYLCPLT